MGKNNQTHHDGQTKTECPDCSRQIRLKPKRDQLPDVREVLCGNCYRRFEVNQDGEVLDG